MDDSLLQAIRDEPERFLRYVNWNKVRSPEDFIREFSLAFDTHIGRNLLNQIRQKHWKILIDHRITQKHFQKLKGQKELEEFMKKKGFMQRVSENVHEQVQNVKWIEVHRKNGQVYKKTYQKWDDKQVNFLKRNLDLPYKDLEKKFNSIFTVQRTIGSIQYKAAALKKLLE